LQIAASADLRSPFRDLEDLHVPGLRTPARQNAGIPGAQSSCRGAGVPMLAGAWRSTPHRRVSTRPVRLLPRPSRSLFWDRWIPSWTVPSWLPCRVPSAAVCWRRSLKAAQQTPVSVVPTMSGHMGGRHLGSQLPSGTRRVGTQGHRVWPGIGASPVLVIGPAVRVVPVRSSGAVPPT
jgi:hypothetical protein